MIKAGHPVFFGCDVGQFSERVGGIMDTALHQYEVRILDVNPADISHLTRTNTQIRMHSTSV